MAHLIINNLEKSFGGTRVINNISFNVQEGEFCILLGPSGCGKSTLGRAILRLAPLSSGEIRFMGDDIGKLDNKWLNPYRAKMHMVVQDPKASLNLL